MSKTGYYLEIKKELAWFFKLPHKQLNSILVNALISLAFFLVGLILGTTNPKVLPFAATVVLLWTLADASLTNQFMFDKKRSTKLLKNTDNLGHVLLVRNLSVVILSIPFCIMLGLLMVAILGDFSELIYGLTLALALIWGWLGISNYLSVYYPFEQLELKRVIKRDSGWSRYVILYSLPWIVLPTYVLSILGVLGLIRVISTQPSTSHIVVSGLVVLAISLAIWLIGLRLVNSSQRKKNKTLVKYLDK